MSKVVHTVYVYTDMAPTLCLTVGQASQQPSLHFSVEKKMDAGEGGEALSGADLVDSQEGSRRRVKLLMKLQGGEKLSSRADGDEEEEEEVARLDALEEMLADLSGRVCR